VGEIDFEAWGTARQKYGIEFAVIHATYLINLASPNPELVEKSKQALVDDLKVADRGGFGGVVVHLGSHLGAGYEAVRKQLIGAMVDILDRSGGGKFLVENSAGQKGKIASGLEGGDLLAHGVREFGLVCGYCHAQRCRL
jgi:deoxyribonuclease-4